jgi:predicted heme/steroid binding protein
MVFPERKVTPTEFRHHTGERYTRKWIAHQGIVYDVTDCPLWKNDLHEHLHFPGQDLSSEILDAPHSQEVFSRPCVKIVGTLTD